MFLDVNDATFHVVSFGGGTDTLVAHGGWVGDWELWQPPFEIMSSHRRCVSYDHRGAGLTRFAAGSISASQMVDDLMAILDKLGIERCVLAGESLGTLVVMRALELYPERFGAAVLVSAIRESTAETTGSLISGCHVDYPATARQFIEASVPEANSEHLKRWGRDIFARSTAEAAIALLESSLYFEVDLARIRTPTLILHGSRDVIVPQAVAEEIAETMPAAELQILDGAGHVPTITEPVRVVDAIDDFLARVRT